MTASLYLAAPVAVAAPLVTMVVAGVMSVLLPLLIFSSAPDGPGGEGGSLRKEEEVAVGVAIFERACEVKNAKW